MRICIFSDLHGNKYAFETFLKTVDLEEFGKVIFCGDLFGYYYYPDIIVQKLLSIKNLYCVRGNHDQNFLDMYNNPHLESGFVEKYGTSYTLKNIPQIKMIKDFIEQMPRMLEMDLHGVRIGIVHGTLEKKLLGRLYPDKELSKPELYLKYDYVFMGHTHYSMIRKIGNTVIVNPGTLGLPRNKEGLTYAVIDLEEKNIELKRLQWNNQQLIKDIKERDSKRPDLVEVLLRERIV